MDKVSRSVSEDGYVSQVKRALGYGIRKRGKKTRGGETVALRGCGGGSGQRGYRRERETLSRRDAGCAMMELHHLRERQYQCVEVQVEHHGLRGAWRL